jgi:hypothetical protein
MSERVTLPAGTRAAFRLEYHNAFDNRFTANIYGSGRSGWFVAAATWAGNRYSAGPQPLGRGQWREFLGLLKQCGFWELPTEEPRSDAILVMDGAWITIAGKTEQRYHEVRRENCVNRRLQLIVQFLFELSGFFAPPEDAEEKPPRDASDEVDFPADL